MIQSSIPTCFKPVRRISALALSLALAFTLTFSVGCAGTGRQEAEKQEFLMDTIISVKAVAGTKASAEQSAADAMDEFRRIGLLTDRFAAPGTPAFEASDVCRINAAAGRAPVKVSPEVLEMVELSLDYGRKSDGAFDIAIGPLMDLWGFAGTSPKVPAPEEIQAALAYSRQEDVLVDSEAGTVFLKKAGMILDLGAVAKGYAAGLAAETLRREGIAEALINAGGNIVTVGLKNGSSKWRIGIEDPRNSAGYVGVLLLEDEAAVTSGDYQRNFTQDGVVYHHILDPSTGMPARGTWSVTVVAKDSGLADVLSTTLFVLGPEKGLKFLEGIPGVEAFFVAPGGAVTCSPGLEGRLESVAGR